MAIVPVACGAPTAAPPTAAAIAASPIPRQTPALPTPVSRGTPLPPPATFTPVVLPTATTEPTITQTPTPTTASGNEPAAFVMPGLATATPAPPAPSGEPDAVETVTQYAADTLGIAVTVVSAGEIDLPPPVQSAVAAGMAAADESVSVTLEDGLAAVSRGDGDSSLGVVVLWRENPLPATAGDTLALVRKTFPALANIPLQAVQSDGSLAAPPGKVLLPPPGGGTPQPLGGGTGATFFTAESERSVLAGVFPAENDTIAVFAIVGNGSFAAMIQP